MAIGAILALTALTGASIYTASQSSKAAKKSAAAQEEVTTKRTAEIAEQKMADEKATLEAESIAKEKMPAGRRLSLISTTPQGVTGPASVGRAKLFGN